MHAPAESQTDFRDALIAVAAIAMAPAIALGIGRFAYALVLPDMQAGFGWSYTQAGTPNALNAFGYLVGAALGSYVAARVGPLRLVIASAIVAAACTLMSAGAFGLISLSALRLVAGIAGAFAIVAGGAVAIGFSERAGARGPLVIGLFYMGPPAGIMVSALVTPAAFALEGGWRGAWLALGLASFVLAAAFLAPSLRRIAPPQANAAVRAPAPLKAMSTLLVGYGVFGAGYIVYMTFMIAYLREGGADAWRESAFWLVIGVAGVAAPWLWSGALARLKGGLAVAAASLVTLLGAIMPLLARSFEAELASGLVFGVAQFVVTAATTVFVRRNLPPAAWAAGVGALTVSFSLGQTIGPVATGFVTDAFGLSAGLGVGAALLFFASLISAAQKDL